MLKVRIKWGTESSASVEIPNTMLKNRTAAISTTFIIDVDPYRPRCVVLGELRMMVQEQGGLDLFEHEFVVVHEYPMPEEGEEQVTSRENEV